MKNIQIKITREYVVDVTVDESIIDKQMLDLIETNFDDEIYSEPDCYEELTKEECGLYNYAIAAAMSATEIEHAEYISLEGEHTKAVVIIDECIIEFNKTETL